MSSENDLLILFVQHNSVFHLSKQPIYMIMKFFVGMDISISERDEIKVVLLIV